MFQESTRTEQPPEGGAAMLRSAMTCSRLREWVKAAQPNARLVYGEGSILAYACSSEVKELVWSLASKGLLTPHFVRGRDGAPSQYMVQRTQREYLKGMEL